jgi:transcriptional regulator with XRE-family HTH domain
MQRFGEKLRNLRKQRGMTLKSLADELGFNSPGSVGDLESGRKKPSLEVALQLSRLFGVSVDQLIKDELEID